MLSGSSLAAIPELAVVLGIMVLVHEFGHFLACKLCGVRVEAFAIGFGKKIFGFVHNGTDYRLNLLPLGGYVKMAGEMGPATDPDAPPPTDDPGELQNHPRWQRTIIALAGPVANFILAFVLMTGVFMAHNEIPRYISQPVVVDYVSPSSPAAKTGVQPGDRVMAFDGVANPDWEDLEVRSQLNLNGYAPFAFEHNGQRVESKLFVEEKSGKPQNFEFEALGLVPQKQPGPLTVETLASGDVPAARAGLKPHDQILSVDTLVPHSVSAFSDYLQDTHGKPVQMKVLRPEPGGGLQTVVMTLTPELADSVLGKRYQIGFGATQYPTVIEHYPLGRAAAESWKENKKDSLLVKDVIGRLFTRQVSVKSLSSPIGIGVQVHQAFDAAGWVPIISTMAMISLQLGIFNLLPIPVLDGGMIFLLIVESVMRRDLNQRLKERMYQVAFVCILLFGAVVIFNDITKLLPLHGKM